MRTSKGRVIAISTVVSLAMIALLASSASAQRYRARTSGAAASFSYSGDEDGWRLELGSDGTVYDAGWFNGENDSDIYCLEVGLTASETMSDYEGVPFALGLGAYHLAPGDPELDEENDIAIWAGAGDFTHARKGLFYQYRYIFSGPLSGSQGIVGWAF
ncbi:MAG: hypothetical protein ACP5KN_03240 [Armatimonadota bacterium]